MTLSLLPNLLGLVDDYQLFLPKSVDLAVATIDGLFAESEGEGRRYLKHFQTKKKAHLLPIALLNKHSSLKDLDFLLEPLLAGENWGLISDCGLPCLADPGAMLVQRARTLHIPIKAYVGPSSITLALIQSGLSGQAFTFHGYVAKQPIERKKELSEWEAVKKMTHIFIEAPYRNGHTLQACLETLHPTTRLCVAVNLTLKDEWIYTDSIAAWKTKNISLPKQPAIFLFLSIK